MIYYAAFVIIFQFGWAAVQISHLSLVPELTCIEYERTELIAIRYLLIIKRTCLLHEWIIILNILFRYSFTVLSNVFVYCITWAILHITNTKDSNSQIGPDDTKKFQEVVFIGIGIGTITSFLFHIFVKENLNNSNGKNNFIFIYYIYLKSYLIYLIYFIIFILGLVNRNSRTISLILKDIQLYQVACIYMPTRLFINLSQIYVPLYLHTSLNMPATSLAIIPLIMYLSSFVMSLIIERLNTKLGRKISYCFGVVLGVCACIWIQFGNDLTYIRYQIYLVFLILGTII